MVLRYKIKGVDSEIVTNLFGYTFSQMKSEVSN